MRWTHPSEKPALGTNEFRESKDLNREQPTLAHEPHTYQRFALTRFTTHTKPNYVSRYGAAPREADDIGDDTSAMAFLFSIGFWLAAIGTSWWLFKILTAASALTTASLSGTILLALLIPTFAAGGFFSGRGFKG